VRHMRMQVLGLSLVAALSVVALTASSASALPEFGQCVVQAKHEGKYTNNVCTKKAKKVAEKFTGEFEWKKALEIPEAQRKLSGESGAAVLRTTFLICEPSAENLEKCREGEEELHFGPITVECEKQRNFAEISPTKASKEIRFVNVRFEGCKALGSIPCANTASPEVIETETLKGKLGFINKASTPREVGILLEPAVKRGEFAKFQCEIGLTTHVGAAKEREFPAYPPKGGGDGIISPITPVNTMTTEHTQVYSINEAEGPEEDENVPSKFAGRSPLKVLEDWTQNSSEPQLRSKWSKAGETLTTREVGCAGSTECEKPTAGEIKAN
jgi:hypothetical protein